ncbi:MAG: hypothetical protein E5V65_09475 [Mesorhizobium sp.]|nr:MAG: hypothetical protein E5V65_09475 [Mesorhizobium sp.]
MGAANYIARSLLETGGFRPQLHPRSRRASKPAIRHGLGISTGRNVAGGKAANLVSARRHGATPMISAEANA